LIISIEKLHRLLFLEIIRLRASLETSLVNYSGFPANMESLSTVQILRSLRGMVSNNFSTISLNVSEAKPLYHSLSHNYLIKNNKNYGNIVYF